MHLVKEAYARNKSPISIFNKLIYKTVVYGCSTYVGTTWWTIVGIIFFSPRNILPIILLRFSNCFSQCLGHIRCIACHIYQEVLFFWRAFSKTVRKTFELKPCFYVRVFLSDHISLLLRTSIGKIKTYLDD